MLEVQDLCVAYGEWHVLHGINLRVPLGSLVALVGPNGAGKTSLLRCIAGMVAPRSGRVTLNGQPLTGLPPHEVVRRGVVMVPEGRRLFARMTVLENLLVAAAHPKARAERSQGLALVFGLFPRLSERRFQAAGTLSGGEQQMLALARGLMARPEVLLLDEPSLGLAPVVVREVFRCIADLRAAGITVLLVEQNVVASLAACDCAYVMENGLIRFQGSGSELSNLEQVRQAYMGV